MHDACAIHINRQALSKNVSLKQNCCLTKEARGIWKTEFISSHFPVNYSNAGELTDLSRALTIVLTPSSVFSVICFDRTNATITSQHTTATIPSTYISTLTKHFIRNILIPMLAVIQ